MPLGRRRVARRRALLTVSGTIPPDLDALVAQGQRPRADYRLLAAAFDADLLDVAAARAAGGRIGRALERVGGAGALIAWACFRQRARYEVIVTDGEQVGLPLAALCRLAGRRGTRHVMIVHILSVPKKVALMRVLRLTNIIDRFVVYCTAQRDHLVDRLGAPPGRVTLTPFMVDQQFFSEAAVAASRQRMICSAGLERRDYPTLMAAVDGLDATVVIAAASPWSKWADSSAAAEPPPNVDVRRLGFVDLRQLYADSSIVVMPLQETDFQAGITTILEAMAMARPVICTRTTGQTDVIVDGATGIYVPPDDPAALRDAIVSLLDDPDRADGLGCAARRWVEEHATVDRYAAGLATVVDAVASRSATGS
jgi:glycosyltransferase involved in cell wall biosynthesis